MTDADRIIVLEGALGHSEREVERLRAELAELKKQELHVREIGWGLVKERDALRAELERMQGVVSSVTGQCDSLGMTVRDIKKERDALRAERDALVEKLRLAWERGDVADAERDALREDAERLDWAEKNPDAAMESIHCWWANCGRRFRETYFNFRGAIDAVRKP